MRPQPESPWELYVVYIPTFQLVNSFSHSKVYLPRSFAVNSIFSLYRRIAVSPCLRVAPSFLCLVPLRNLLPPTTSDTAFVILPILICLQLHHRGPPATRLPRSIIKGQDTRIPCQETPYLTAEGAAPFPMDNIDEVNVGLLRQVDELVQKRGDILG